MSPNVKASVSSSVSVRLVRLTDEPEKIEEFDPLATIIGRFGSSGVIDKLGEGDLGVAHRYTGCRQSGDGELFFDYHWWWNV